MAEAGRWRESRCCPPLADLAQAGRRDVAVLMCLESDDVRGQPTQGAAPYSFPWAWQGRPSPCSASSAPAAHSSEELSPSLPAASGYARSSVSTAWTNAAVPGGPDALVVTAGGRGATGDPAPKGKGAGGAGPRPFRCAATASRSARPWARSSGDCERHSHTQCPRWPQNERAPRRRGGAAISGAPPYAPPRGGGAPPRGKRGGRSECGKTVPARGGTGVPDAMVPRPRPAPVRTGYSSGRPPHAGCCCQPDACGRLFTGSTGTSPGGPYSTGAAAAVNTAAQSACSASVPYSVTARAAAAEAARTGRATDAAGRARRAPRSSPPAYRGVPPLGLAWSLTPRASRVAVPVLAKNLRSLGKVRPWVLNRGCHGYIPEDYIRALYPYPLRIRAGDAYPKFIMKKEGQDISILSDRNCKIISDPYPRYESQDAGIYTVMNGGYSEWRILVKRSRPLFSRADNHGINVRTFGSDKRRSSPTQVKLFNHAIRPDCVVARV